MTYLFDSSGRHIANFIDHQLYAPTGNNVGHYLQDQQIFIDMDGRYLGEIVSDNRPLQMLNSLAGYKDIVADWMS